jgi:hypothetical protein
MGTVVKNNTVYSWDTMLSSLRSARGKEEVYYANQIDLCLSLDLAWESYSKQ